MSKPKHTPGPWTVSQLNDGTLDVCKNGGEIRSRIARLHFELLADEHGGSIEANARLIAAAPAMYETLRECLTHNGSYGMQEGLGRAKRRLLEINRIVQEVLDKIEL